MLVTSTEYTSLIQRFFNKFAYVQLNNANGHKWMVKTDSNDCNAKLLYLYYFAVSTYVHDTTTDNYITEREVLKIFAKVNGMCGGFDDPPTYYDSSLSNNTGNSTVSITPIEFTVSGISDIVTGTSTLTIPSAVGCEMIFVRNSDPQYQYSDGTNTYYTWNKATGIFQCFGVASAGEQFSLRPYRL